MGGASHLRQSTRTIASYLSRVSDALLLLADPSAPPRGLVCIFTTFTPRSRELCHRHHRHSLGSKHNPSTQCFLFSLTCQESLSRMVQEATQRAQSQVFQMVSPSTSAHSLQTGGRMRPAGSMLGTSTVPSILLQPSLRVQCRSVLPWALSLRRKDHSPQCLRQVSPDT